MHDSFFFEQQDAWFHYTESPHEIRYAQISLALINWVAIDIQSRSFIPFKKPVYSSWPISMQYPIC